MCVPGFPHEKPSLISPTKIQLALLRHAAEHQHIGPNANEQDEPGFQPEQLDFNEIDGDAGNLEAAEFLALI